MKVKFYPGSNKPVQEIDLDPNVFYEEDYEWFVKNNVEISMEYLPNGGPFNLTIYGYIPKYMPPEEERIVLTSMAISDIKKKEKFRELREAITNWVKNELGISDYQPY